MIVLENINKTYHNGAPLHVLKGIDLEIEKGELVSIMGASGSGKSTLLNILGILDDYDTGEYFLNGRLIKHLSETQAAAARNNMIGYIFPVVQPDKLQERGRKRRPSPLLPGRFTPQAQCRSPRIPRPAGTPRLGQPHAQRDVGRPEAARGHRPGIDQQAPDHSRRRTYGRPDSKTSQEVMDLLRQVNGTGMTIICVTHEQSIADQTGQRSST